MPYENQIYGIFNQNNIQQQYRQFQQQQYHNDQVRKSFDCAHKVDELLKSIDQVDPQYRSFAYNQCCAVLFNHMRNHGMM